MPILLTADRVLPGPAAGAVIPHGGVLVNDGRISDVGTAAELTANHPDAEHQHHPGATIMPGLIDTHAHLTGDAGADQQQILDRIRDRDDDVLLADMHGRAAAAQRAGITTIRDVGSTRGLVARLREGDDERRLPRLLTSGSPITVPGGDAAEFGGVVDSAESQLREAVAERAEAGVDWISIIASGGHLSPASDIPPWQRQFNREQLEVLLETAAEHELPTAAHAHGTESIGDAVALGATTIDHASFVRGAGDIAYDDTIGRAMADEGIGACITASQNWRRIAARLGERAHDLYSPIPQMHAAGVPLLAGSRGGTANAPAHDLVSTLELLEFAGIPVSDVLAIATTGAATALDLGETTGQINPGLAADLIAVDGDPRTDLGALRRLCAVYQGGRSR